MGLPGGLSDAIRNAYAGAGGIDALGCPRAPVQRWGDGGLQEFSTGNRQRNDISAVVAPSVAPAVVVLPEPWRSYRTLRSVALLLFGVPVGEPSPASGGWVVELSKGGVLF